MMATANLALILAVWAGVAWIVVSGVPLTARSRLVLEVTRVRDQVEDEGLAGTVDLSDGAVREFLDVCNAIVDYPTRFGLSESMAVHIAHETVGCDFAPRASYSALRPEQRRRMGEAEKLLNQTLRHYVIFGSRFWPLLLGTLGTRRLLYRMNAVSRPSQDVRASSPLQVSPEELVRDLRRGARERLHTVRHHGRTLSRI